MISYQNVNIWILIVTYNASKWIDTCLESILNSSIQVKSLIIDNNSSDGTIEIIERKYPEAIVIRNTANYGFGKANNIGIKYSLKQNADYIFLLNQDAWLLPDTIEKLLFFQNNNPHYGILSPVHINKTENELDKNFTNYTSFNNLAEIREAVGKSIRITETKFVNAAAWLLSKECVLKVGGFDPLFYHYGEDRDYCNRTIHHGYKIAVILNTFAIHDRDIGLKIPSKKIYNLLFSSGLAQVKNLDKSLIINYLFWIASRIKKMFKCLLLFDIRSLYYELLVIGKLLLLTKKIKKSRRICKSTMAYL